MLLLVSSLMSTKERAVKLAKTKCHEYRTVGHPQLVRHQRFQFIFRQELTFRHIRADVELGKRFFGISPLKCTHMTTPFSHMHFSHIVPL